MDEWVFLPEITDFSNLFDVEVANPVKEPLNNWVSYCTVQCSNGYFLFICQRG